MCVYCAYNQDGFCYAPHTWWKYDTEDGSCSLFIEKDKKEADDNAAE